VLSVRRLLMDLLADALTLLPDGLAKLCWRDVADRERLGNCGHMLVARGR